MQPHPLTGKRLSWRPLLLAVALCLCLCCGRLGVSYALADDPTLVPEDPGSISGAVTDENGVPLSEIEVSIYGNSSEGWTPIRWLTTDAEGKYKAAVLGTGIYHVGFRDPQGVYATEYYTNALTASSGTDVLVAGKDITGINAQLAPGGGISGTIRVTGPLSTTICTFCGNLNVQTKSNGKWQTMATTAISTPVSIYRIMGLPAGAYRVCTSSLSLFSPPTQILGECYDNVASGVDNAQDVSVVAGQITPNIDFVLDDDADLATIGGQVTSPTGLPLAQISVYVQPWSSFSAQQRTVDGGGGYTAIAQTDSAGFYRATGLLPGEYVVWFSDPRGPYLDQYYNNTERLEFANHITLGTKEQRLDVNVSLALGGQITGTVTLLHQAPAVGATVTFIANDQPLFGFYRSIGVDPKTGVYRSDGLPPGEYRVLANSRGDLFNSFAGYYGGADYEHATKLVLGAGEIKPNIDIDLGNSKFFDGSIAGQVSAQGVPQAGIKVSLLYAFDPLLPLFYTYTDTSGHYTIEGLTDGVYSLSFTDPSGIYATTYYTNHPSLQAAQKIQLLASRPITNANVALRRGGSISGHLALHNGTPLANGLATVYNSQAVVNNSTPYMTQTTDANGDYKLQGLWPGSYRVCFTYSAPFVFANRCYGATDPNSSLFSATEIPVTAGVETKGIDMVFGSVGPGRLYLPQITR